MQKIISIIFAITLLFSANTSILAQSRKSNVARRKTTTSTGKKQSGKKTSSKKTAKTVAVNKSAVSKSREFEGSLTYINYTYASKAMRKNTNHLAQNGNSVMIMTMKKNKLHTYDQLTHIHQIFDKERNLIYMYSDLTHTGVSYPLDKYISKYVVQPIKMTDAGKTTYKGDNLRIVKIDQKSSDVEVNYQEYWYSKDFTYPQIMKSVFPVYCSFNGIVKKGVTEFKSTVPILGIMHMLVSTELVGIKEGHVPQTMFEVPGDIKITPDDVNTYKLFGKVTKANAKKLKKLGLVSKDDYIEAYGRIKDQWPNVQNWESEESQSGSIAKYIFGEMGPSLISAAADLTVAIIGTHTFEQSYDEEGGGSSSNSNTSSDKKRSYSVCAFCKGSKVCKFCRGSGQGPRTIGLSSNIHEKCHYCHGTRTCKPCKGTGWNKGKVPPAGYQGIDSESISESSPADSPLQTKDCRDCNGSGVCGECNGNGWRYFADLRPFCTKCNGTGICTTCQAEKAAHAKQKWTEEDAARYAKNKAN